MRGPRSISKLVNITTITRVFMIVITIVRWAYKPIYNWGAPLCSIRPISQGDVRENPQEIQPEHHGDLFPCDGYDQ